MALIELAVEAFDDLERIRLHLETTDQDVGRVIRTILACLRVLEHTPQMGRPARGALRELVILQGRAGYLAAYQYDPALDVVRILRIRHQREAGYP